MMPTIERLINGLAEALKSDMLAAGSIAWWRSNACRAWPPCPRQLQALKEAHSNVCGERSKGQLSVRHCLYALSLEQSNQLHSNSK